MVGVPVYNEERYIEKTINSLICQDIENVNFVISDNASTDRTWSIIQDLAGSDRRFRLCLQEVNKGSAYNFSYVYRQCSGDYFMWLGGHDCLSPGLVRKAAEILDGDVHEKISMVSGIPVGFYEGDSIFEVPDAVYDFSMEKPIDRFFRSVQQLCNCTIFHSMFRRKTLDNLEQRAVASADHVIISFLLWFGKLAYVEDEYYQRRYFREQRPSSAQRHVAGTQNQSRWSRYDFCLYYLDTFDMLYQGDQRVRHYLRAKLLSLIERRFGLGAFEIPENMT